MPGLRDAVQGPLPNGFLGSLPPRPPSSASRERPGPSGLPGAGEGEGMLAEQYGVEPRVLWHLSGWISTSGWSLAHAQSEANRRFDLFDLPRTEESDGLFEV